MLLCKFLGKTVSIYLWLWAMCLILLAASNIIKLMFSSSFDAIIGGLLICILCYMVFTIKFKSRLPKT
jgi:uncharacterized membrane protein YccC